MRIQEQTGCKPVQMAGRSLLLFSFKGKNKTLLVLALGLPLISQKSLCCAKISEASGDQEAGVPGTSHRKVASAGMFTGREAASACTKWSRE